MIRKIIKEGSNHLSLSVIVIGALCFFIANVVLKEKLTHQEYGLYSLVITFFSMMNLYGLLGLEQVFIRFSDFYQKNKIFTPLFILKLVAVIIVVSSFFGTLLFIQYATDTLQLNFLLVLFATISIVSLLFIYNVLRLNSDFVLSQVFFNLWKFFLIILVLLSFVFFKLNIVLFINLLMTIIILSFLISFYFCFKRIQFSYKKNVSKTDIIKTSIQFLISITSFSLLIFGDRFIIEHKFGIEEFGNYFYLTNFFLAPFSILQNYIGFKHLIIFKLDFKVASFNNFNRKIIFFGICLSLSLFIFLKTVSYYSVLNFDFNHYNLTIILMLIMGIIRLYSSSITSAFEAKTNVNTFKKGNIIFIVLSLIIVFIDFIFINTLDLIICSIILIWLIRSIVFRQLLLGQINKELK